MLLFSGVKYFVVKITNEVCFYWQTINDDNINDNKIIIVAKTFSLPYQVAQKIGAKELVTIFSYNIYIVIKYSYYNTLRVIIYLYQIKQGFSSEI